MDGRGSDTSDEAVVVLLPAGRVHRTRRGAVLIEAIREAGLPLASACDARGLCARCAVEVPFADPPLAPERDWEREARRRNRIPDGLRLACALRVRGTIHVRARYW